MINNIYKATPLFILSFLLLASCLKKESPTANQDDEVTQELIPIEIGNTWEFQITVDSWGYSKTEFATLKINNMGVVNDESTYAIEDVWIYDEGEFTENNLFIREHPAGGYYIELADEYGYDYFWLKDPVKHAGDEYFTTSPDKRLGRYFVKISTERESVSVEAGTFNSYKYTVTQPNNNNEVETFKIYLSPGIGVIKMTISEDFIDNEGNYENYSYTEINLISYTLK